MDAKEVRTKLVVHTQQHCRLFDNRQYLDISRLGECPRKLVWEMLHECEAGENIRIRLYKAQQMEMDLALRLVSLFGSAYKQPKPIRAMDDRLMGFTSGNIGDTLIIIKSVPDDEALPNGRAHNNHFWQTQALMHFGSFANCVIIYESRSSGRIRTYDLSYSRAIGQKCEQKAKLVLASVKNGRLPKCDCGKCKMNGYDEK